MASRWRLTVEGLGRIEHAEVDVRPLTLFAGPNNSGKSYLASLLWGLVAMQWDMEPPEGPERDACDAWLRTHMSSEQSRRSVTLSPDDAGLFADLFQAALNAGGARLVNRIFNVESMGVGRVSFRNMVMDPSLTFESSVRTNHYSFGAAASGYGFLLVLPNSQLDDSAVAFARKALTQFATWRNLALTGLPFQDSFRDSDPIYLPASRTGFMQLYKTAARRSLRTAFRPDAGERQELDLTTPAFHFIDMIAFGLRDRPTEPYAAEADYLERAMSGRVELLTTKGVNEYRYHPAGASTPLPMKLSSALVTELAPLVLVLRHLEHFPAIILEEPEAHVHPELQRRVAQVVVRLIRKGVCVWITTHSENFCQQINNFLKLGSLPEDVRAQAQKQLGYEPQDYLVLDDVSGYEVRPDAADVHSDVVEMKRTEAGLVMPTFNKAIVRLSKEVFYLDDLLEAQRQ